jgi:DNA (cytosine-5)-methyltransferase 1
MGYHRAGFDVVGVDHKAQPRYPFEHIVADALEYCAEHGHEFDAIHASPPCQAYSVMRSLHNAKPHPDLIPGTRVAVISSGRPWVIENVPGSPLYSSLMLCGSMFGLRSHRGYLRRHRHFECSVLVMAPGPCRHEGLAIGVYGHGSAGHLGQRMRTANVDEARVLMGMPWSTRDGLSQAIPPAYTEYIGRQLMQAVGSG